MVTRSFSAKLPRLYFSRLTIRQRLPVLICLLLLAIIIVFGGISYFGIRKATLKVGEERLQSLSFQLSTMLSASTLNLVSTTYSAANNKSVRQYLHTNGKDSAAAVKTIFQNMKRDSSNVKVELLNLNRQALIGYSLITKNFPVATASILTDLDDIDSGFIGKMYILNDSIYFPVISVIREGDIDLGYLVRWKRMVSRGVDQITQLMGTDAKFYLGNRDGSTWTDMVKTVMSPPVNEITFNKIVEFKRENKQRVLASMHPIANSPWLVSVEFPKNKVMQAAETFIYWLAISDAILLLLGVFVTWLLSRNLTRPLHDLTIAASQIATGNYSSQVDVDRYDELGKLARAFSAMANKVHLSQVELLRKAQNYKILFERNPIAMWIISKSTFDILAVNDVAVKEYGYTRQEFLKLNSRDLRPPEDVEKYMNYVKSSPQNHKSGIWRHLKKDGTIIMVDVIADNIIYEGHEARIVLANDVTEKLRMEAELVNHRIMQQEMLTETAIQAQEKEREELGKELHDNINQILASTKLYLELARNGSSELLTQAISKSYENVNLAIGEIRQLSKQLVPPKLEDMLVNILNEMAEEIQATTNIRVILNLESFDEIRLNDKIKLTLYRVIQEQVNNIIKHARATQVSISLANDEDSITLLIADNGIGFNTNQKSKGIGLRNINNRVNFYKGHANITSQPGKGCTLEVFIPFEKEEPVLS